VTFGGLGVTIPNGSSVNLLVTYDFDVVTLTGNAAPTRWVRPAKPGPGLPVAAMALVALASGLMFLLRLHGKRPRRPLAAVRALVAAGLVTAALFASSCLLKPLKDSTYAAVLANSANVRAQGVSSGSPAAVTGTFPVAGAWKSVDTIDGGL
jgi:hypothetical protein